MHRLCEYIDKELMEMERGVADGKRLSAAELEYADKLAHLKKSILTNEAMEEAYDDDGYSRHYDDGRRMRDDGYSYAGRGRGRTARRDSMGRYSRGGYSYDEGKDDMMKELREIKAKAPDDRTRQKIEHFISEMESM